MNGAIATNLQNKTSKTVLHVCVKCRHIPQTQDRILDAPDLVDDYYLNLLDWSCNNVVRVVV